MYTYDYDYEDFLDYKDYLSTYDSFSYTNETNDYDKIINYLLKEKSSKYNRNSMSDIDTDYLSRQKLATELIIAKNKLKKRERNISVWGKRRKNSYYNQLEKNV